MRAIYTICICIKWRIFIEKLAYFHACRVVFEVRIARRSDTRINKLEKKKAEEDTERK